MYTNEAGFPQFESDELVILRKAQVILGAVDYAPGRQYVAAVTCDKAVLAIHHAMRLVAEQKALAELL